MKKQRGFTVFELVFVLAGLVGLAFTAGLLYTLWHFVSKFW
jgi:hypothetical protein